MTIYLNKVLFLVAFISLNIFNVYSQPLKILTSNVNEFSFEYNYKLEKFRNVTDINGILKKIPVIEFAEITSNPGEPVKFEYSFNIAVPSENGFKLVLNGISTDIISKIELADTKPLNVNGEFIKNKFTPNKDIISKNQVMFDENNDFIKIEYLGIANNKHIAKVTISPYIYDKLKKSIISLKNLQAEIIFDKNYSKTTFNDDYNYGNAINFNETKIWGIKQNSNYAKFNDKLLGNDLKMTELSNGKWIRIAVKQEGIFKIEASDIQSFGYQISPNEVNSIKVFGIGGKPLGEKVSDALSNKMNQQDIIVNKNQDGSLKNIIFYGAGTSGFENKSGKIKRFNNYYTTTTYYLLTWGGIDGNRAVEQPVPQGSVVNNPVTYTERYLFEEDIVNPYTPGAGRDWYGRTFFSAPFNPVMLHNLDRSGTIKYRFALAHRSYRPDLDGSNYGTFTIFENNNKIGSVTLSPTGNYIAALREFVEISLPASSISSDNRSIIKLDYKNNADQSATSYFDFFEIHYPRNFYAVNNSINFFTDENLNGITQFTINGFNGGEIYGFDITEQSNPKLLKNNSSTGGMFVIINDLAEKNIKNLYVSSNTLVPELTKTEVANLRDNEDNSDVVVIAHPDMLESAVKYKEYREIQGHKVSVFRTDHIYNEFASGNPDVTAIRDFLAYLKEKWNGKPEYVVLWGDGHYDFRNITTQKTNYIPAYQTYSDDLKVLNEIEENYATDDFFGLLIGNDLMADVKLGRLTIDKPELGFDILEKIKNYENNSSEDQWRTNTILIADDGPTSNGGYEGTWHTSPSEQLQEDYISVFAPSLQYEKLYLVEYPAENIPNGKLKPKVTEDMLTRINTTGALLLNWFGHGNPRVWAHENILVRDVTIPQMKNINKPFLLTAATCDFGRFDNPEVRSGSEEMFLSKIGGAIGVLSATRVVYANENSYLTNDFYTFLLSKDTTTGLYPTLGEVIMKLKQKRTGSNDRKYFLLGDPLVKILLPENVINIDSINGIALNAIDTTQIKALSKIRLSGSIKDRFGKNVLNDYNGILTVTLRDGDKKMQLIEVVDGQPRAQFNFTKLGGSLNRSSYKVENGEFTAEFIIPKDISYSELLGRLFTYSYSNDKRYAMGSYHNMKINGFDITDIQDNDGPKIDIFLDSRSFVNGEVVTENPLLIVDLFDESGINTTGLGIGHKIEAWLDDSQTSIDLTDKFTTSLSDSRKGTVQNVLYGLQPGLHKIKIRAWDVFNNYSVTESNFRINPDGNGYFLDNLLNYPNPFNQSTTIRFRHNAVTPFKLKVEIYTINGQLIRVMENNITTNHESEILWDGYDENNYSVPSGNYLYKVEIPNDGNGKTIKFGSFNKIN